MNAHDRANLKFLLNASTQVIKDWYSQVSADDVSYAMELMEAYRQELIEQAELDDIDTAVGSMTSFPLVDAIIAKFAR